MTKAVDVPASSYTALQHGRVPPIKVHRCLFPLFRLTPWCSVHSRSQTLSVRTPRERMENSQKEAAESGPPPEEKPALQISKPNEDAANRREGIKRTQPIALASPTALSSNVLRMKSIPTLSEWVSEPYALLSRKKSSDRLDDEVHYIQREVEKNVLRVLDAQKPQARPDAEKAFDLSDVLPVMRDGFQSAIDKHSFINCFQSKAPPRWTFGILLMLQYILGVFVRYSLLLPLRIAIFLLGNFLFALSFALSYFLPSSNFRTSLQRTLLRLYASVWCLSIGAVVRYHGEPPIREPNQIFVSNHSSLIDYVLLLNYSPFASVGQKYTSGFLGFMTKYVIGPLSCIWFERFEAKDRHQVARRIKDHIADPTKPPLLLFPEGVCVNNEYCVMFKKGAFELDATICPVAIKFNKMFSDPYWNSRKESFLGHILRLMRSWCTVANVYFLDPETIKEGESSAEFADRVKERIANKIGLKNVPWDGYLKYYSPSQRYTEHRQKMYANVILERMDRMKAGTPSTSHGPTSSELIHRHVHNSETPADGSIPEISMLLKSPSMDMVDDAQLENAERIVDAMKAAITEMKKSRSTVAFSEDSNNEETN